MFFEPDLIGEYYCLKSKRENSYLMMKGSGGEPKPFFASLDCYLFTGIGALAYNVKPNDKLAPRATSTKGFTPVIPIGIGVKLVYSSDLNFGVELGGRFTFTDNIDGYTSQYSKSNDRYLFFNFNCTYKIKLKEQGVTMFSRRSR